MSILPEARYRQIETTRDAKHLRTTAGSSAETFRTAWPNPPATCTAPSIGQCPRPGPTSTVESLCA
jgi:hypothetical protein